ncbi:hypothetical protein ACWGH3_33185 [Streptomyces sp. NPDC054884]
MPALTPSDPKPTASPPQSSLMEAAESTLKSHEPGGGGHRVPPWILTGFLLTVASM